MIIGKPRILSASLDYRCTGVVPAPPPPTPTPFWLYCPKLVWFITIIQISTISKFAEFSSCLFVVLLKWFRFLRKIGLDCYLSLIIQFYSESLAVSVLKRGGGGGGSMLQHRHYRVTNNHESILAHLIWKLIWDFLITWRPLPAGRAVCLSVRPSVCLTICKLFTFSTSTP